MADKKKQEIKTPKKVEEKFFVPKVGKYLTQTEINLLGK